MGGAPLKTTAARSALMKRVRRKGTEPEIRLRSMLHARGLRFATSRWSLPGTPDLVLPRRSTVIFVHGCFWHGHDCRHGSVESKTNTDFWNNKIADNRARDRRKEASLRALGWWVEVVWACELGHPLRIETLVKRLLRR